MAAGLAEVLAGFARVGDAVGEVEARVKDAEEALAGRKGAFEDGGAVPVAEGAYEES